MTRLVEPAVTEPFRKGREFERDFAATIAAPGWPRERWAARAVDLARRIEEVDTIPASQSRIAHRNYLFGRLSIATDLAEGRSIT